MSDSHEETSAATMAFLRWFRAAALLTLIAGLGYLVWQNATTPEAANPFKLGLDLAGGSHLVYEADTSGIAAAEVPALMEVLRDVIERRVNIFGVSEPLVQVERSSFAASETVERLVVELPGVTNVSEAVAEIGRTPLLEFKLYDAEIAAQLDTLAGLAEIGTSSPTEIADLLPDANLLPDSPYIDTGLTGRYLESAALEVTGNSINQVMSEPVVSIRFNSEGAQLFADITRANVGQPLAIFLDGELISAPNINEPIVGGTAVISGGFTTEEARALAQNLSFGALPVPITLQSTQTVGASLGEDVLVRGIWAGIIGLSIILLFMVLWYRLPGLLAGIALVSYVIIMLALFQYIPVTLTAAGLAGFVLSIGMAVDANVLVFERMKEEFRAGKSSRSAAIVGFTRAWSAIRDGNVTSLLSAIVLFWFGTSMVKGFALVFGIGVIFSMLTTLVITRTLLITMPDVVSNDTKKGRLAILFGSGFKK